MLIKKINDFLNKRIENLKTSVRKIEDRSGKQEVEMFLHEAELIKLEIERIVKEDKIEKFNDQKFILNRDSLSVGNQVQICLHCGASINHKPSCPKLF